jgi:hypothetical protein
LQGKNVRAAGSDTHLERLQERRNRLCRLTPDLALQSLDEAHAFLRDRGLLTRTADCSLPGLFEACHEEPYAPDKAGFGQWPRTKWGWSFALAQRPGVYALKIHHRRKTLYLSDDVARIVDPIIRDEIERMRENAEWARVLDHLADAGPSTSEDLRTELGLKPQELKKLLYPLELCGTVLVRPGQPSEEGRVDGFAYARWDDVYAEPAPGPATLDELVVAGVRAAVVATERELARWFAWRWRFEADLVDRLVSEGRLERPEAGWVAAPMSA